jgi:hypothetical protein
METLTISGKTVNLDVNKKIILSTLWIFVLLNYLYCDILTLMDRFS